MTAWDRVTRDDVVRATQEYDRLARMTLPRELAATAISNAQACEELRLARAELMASRARIAAAADETRRRIERDLHDGAQQQLVSLALRLRLAQASVPPGLCALQAELGRVAAALTSTAGELREYVHGIYPAILAQRGLGAALKTLARRSPVPVQLEMRTTARLPEPVEMAAYYLVSEALTNAAKHANASVARVAVGLAGGVLRLSVSDDGVGGADPARGSGLAGLRDRVEVAGGTLVVRSPHGDGTRLIAELPVRPLAAAAENGPPRHGSLPWRLREGLTVPNSPPSDDRTDGTGRTVRAVIAPRSATLGN